MVRGRPSRTTLYARLESAVEELRDRLGGLPSPKESEPIWSDIWHQEAHHSTALEGNTLVLREVAQLLEQGRAVGAKPLREYTQVKGYADAARWVYGQAVEPDDWSDGGLMNLNEVRRIHHMAMTPVWDVAALEAATAEEGPGNFRRHDIHRFPGGMAPPPWEEVPAQTSDWVTDVNATGLSLRAAALSSPLPPHCPRNSRVCTTNSSTFTHSSTATVAGRLALNLILVRLGYPPVVILKRQRQAYLSAMEKSDAGDHGLLGELIARAMLDNLNRFIVPNVAGPARLVPLAALMDGDFSLPALRQAAQRGRLEAMQGPDGIWRSSRRAVQAYKRSKHRRRPKSV